MRLWILALLLLPANGLATDVSLEIGAGQTAYHVYGDGIWYQEGVPHTLHRFGDAYLAGIRIGVRPWWDVHIDYANMGNVSASCLCVSDADYNSHTHKVINSGEIPVKFNGYGYVDGVQIKNTFSYSHLGIDVGVLIYRNTWHETLYGWYSPQYPEPVNAAISASRKIRVAPMAGISVKEGNFTLSADEVFMKALPYSYGVPPLWEKASMVTLSYALPL